MDGNTLLMLGIVVAGVYVVYKMNGETLPSIPANYLFPAKKPDYPTALDAPLYSSPPASQNPTLPDLADAGVCPVTSRADFDALSPTNSAMFFPSDDSFNTYLAGERARAGCFSPPNKS
jgi:hypothetical protein